MKAFMVELDGPEVLVRITEAIAGKGANLTAVSILPGPPACLGFIAEPEDAARDALATIGVRAREHEVIPMSIANEPGALARAARALDAAGAPIELLLTLRATRGHVVDMIAVTDPAKAHLVIRGLPADEPID